MANEDTRATVVDPDPDLPVAIDRDTDLTLDDEYDDVPDLESPAPLAEPRKHKRSGLAEWIIVVVVAISSALLVRAYVLQQFAVEGTSMLNTLHPSDRVLVNKLSYRLHDPRRGDVVVLKRIETNAKSAISSSALSLFLVRPSSTTAASCSSTGRWSSSHTSTRRSSRRIAAARINRPWWFNRNMSS